MDLLQFIPESLLILIVANYCLGIFAKQVGCSTKFLPIVILAFSIIFSCLLVGLQPMSIIQGILCWGVSSGVYDIKKQLSK